MPELSEIQITKVSDYGTFAVDPNNPNLTAVQTDDGPVDSRSSHSGGVNAVMGDGSVRSTDTSAVATMMDFDFPSSTDTHDPLVLVTDADPEGAIAGVIIAATTDNNHIDEGSFTDPWLFPTETISPTETIRPMESLDDGGIIIIGGFPTETIRPMESIHPFEVLI